MAMTSTSAAGTPIGLSTGRSPAFVLIVPQIRRASSSRA
jgi:hypothetical protein